MNQVNTTTISRSNWGKNDDQSVIFGINCYPTLWTILTVLIWFFRLEESLLINEWHNECAFNAIRHHFFRSRVLSLTIMLAAGTPGFLVFQTILFSPITSRYIRVSRCASLDSTTICSVIDCSHYPPTLAAAALAPGRTQNISLAQCMSFVQCFHLLRGHY